MQMAHTMNATLFQKIEILKGSDLLKRFDAKNILF